MEQGRSAFKNVYRQAYKERDLYGGKGVDDRTILEWTLNKYISVLRNWADWAQDRDYLRTLVNTALNFWVP